MDRVEGAEQPLAKDAAAAAEAAMTELVVVVVVVIDGDGEERRGPEEGEDSRQWAELKWSRREEESGAVKSQRRQRQQAWTRLRGERGVSLGGRVVWSGP
jgi:hypothetical protein